MIKGSHEPGINPLLPLSRNQHCPATRQREELAWALRTTARCPCQLRETGRVALTDRHPALGTRPPQPAWAQRALLPFLCPKHPKLLPPGPTPADPNNTHPKLQRLDPPTPGSLETSSLARHPQPANSSPRSPASAREPTSRLVSILVSGVPVTPVTYLVRNRELL